MKSESTTVAMRRNVVEPKESSTEEESSDEDASVTSSANNIPGPRQRQHHRQFKNQSNGAATFKDPKTSITFLGRNITSKFGIQLFKFMSIIIPLLPTFALVLYNSIQLESLITRSNLLAESFEQVMMFFYHENYSKLLISVSFLT